MARLTQLHNSLAAQTAILGCGVQVAEKLDALPLL